MKLQNAYVTEAAAVGAYVQIGYEIPGSSTFDYTEPSTSYSDNTIALTALSANTLVWQAKNIVPLNNCAKDNYWVLKASVSGVGVEYSGAIGTANTATAFDNNCVALAPAFKTIADNN